MGGSGGKMGGNTPPRPPPHIVENERPGAGQASKNVKLYHIKVGDFLTKFQETSYHYIFDCPVILKIPIYMYIL